MMPLQFGGRVVTKDTDTARILAEIQRNWGGLVELSPDPVFVVRREGRYVYVTPACARLFGVNRKEMVGKRVADFFPAADARVVMEGIERVFVDNRAIQREEQFVRGDRVLHFLTTLAPICDANGAVNAVVGLSRDFTDRRAAEIELQRSRSELRRLARHEQAILEQERARIAGIVHDEVGQTLTALKLDLAWLKARLHADQGALSDVVESMTQTIDEAVEKVRDLSASLRPRMLDELGLKAAIGASVRRFRKRTGIECICDLSQEPDTAVASERATALYRIFQELITNVARHSGATELRVGLRFSGDDVELTVEDNGKGISGAEAMGVETSGLVGVRERVLQFGGEVEISGRNGRGTRAVVKLKRSDEADIHE